MKVRFTAFLVGLALVLGTSVAFAEDDGPTVPEGWTFQCVGTTAVYIGPNGSYFIVHNSRFCEQKDTDGPAG